MLASSCFGNWELQLLDWIDTNEQHYYISDEGLVDIITALSIHPRLQHLDLEDNCLQKNGCIALATLLKCSAAELQQLDLGSNELDDESIGVLVPVLKNYSHLEESGPLP